MIKIKAHCNACGQETSHAVLYSESQKQDLCADSGEPYGYFGEDYQLIKCLGCELIKLKVKSHSSEYDPYVAYYPPAISRKFPEWLESFVLDGIMDASKRNIAELVREIYKGLQNRLPRLVAMGVRGLIELIMIQQNEDKGTLGKNIDALHASGYLSEKDRGYLHKVLDAGSAVIHRGHSPTDEEVLAMVDIAEHLLAAVYFIGERAETVSRRVLPRSRVRVPRSPEIPSASSPDE